MNAADHYPVLKRTGLVLLVVGVLDIGLMAYAIFNQIAYASSFNIFAVIAGIFLLRGSLRAASLVRRFALFLLAASISVSLVLPLLQPIDLIVTRVQLNPMAFLGILVFLVLALILFSWLIRELGSAPVRLAHKKAGLPTRSPGIPWRWVSGWPSSSRLSVPWCSIRSPGPVRSRRRARNSGMAITTTFPLSATALPAKESPFRVS